jgi:uncharacterized protein YbaA (DUF1428 family)
MKYVDGFVVPVPKKNLPADLKMARKAGKVWRDYGALEFCEDVADDVKPGKWTPRRHDGRQDDAVRRQAHDLRRLQEPGSDVVLELLPSRA